MATCTGDVSVSAYGVVVTHAQLPGMERGDAEAGYPPSGFGEQADRPFAHSGLESSTGSQMVRWGLLSGEGHQASLLAYEPETERKARGPIPSSVGTTVDI